eukprot:symbB.v1.2.021173.t1/scaffold1779.1/size154953/1
MGSLMQVLPWLVLWSPITCIVGEEAPKGKEGVKECQDTPGWSNGWSACAWLPGGKDPTLCRPTMNASWPSTAGWTCEYYRQQGLCGKKSGAVKEIRQSARGPFHNWPEKNCCGCEEQDDTNCNRQTGKICALEFGTCGFSKGPAYCHNFSQCLCLPGHCADSSGICSLSTEQVLTDKVVESMCWSACAYEEGGHNAAWCKPTLAAAWPSTLGWTCEYYRVNGLCKDGTVESWAGGEMHNYPEYNCCGCQKSADTTCNRNTGGICFLGVCDTSRGPTECVHGQCLCQEGHCGTTTGVCSLTVLTPEGIQEAAGEATDAGISAAEAAKSSGKNAAEDVKAAAIAAGQAAVSAGLSREDAAEAASTAAGDSAASAKATPQQAADAAATWEADSAGLDQQDQAKAAAKAAAEAAKKAAQAVFLTEQQSHYAAFAGAVKAGLETGLSIQQAESVAMAAMPGSHNSKERGKGAGNADFGPDMMIQDSSSKDSNLFSQFFGGQFLIILLLAMAVVGCYFCRKGMKSHGDYRVYSGDQECGKERLH